MEQYVNFLSERQEVLEEMMKTELGCRAEQRKVLRADF